MKNVIIIFGPTASGKTGVSIKLAKELDGEIISSDSMQIYKYMDIGTAKATIEEMNGIKHYMVDEVSPNEEFSVAKFQEKAHLYIEEILEKGKTPVIVGGTGLYINSLIYNINFSETIINWELREKLKKEAEEMGNEYVHEKLREVDPEAADRLHVNDVKRVIRALEVFDYTKKTISYHQEISRQDPPKYNYILIGLRMDREKLYNRIDQRVDNMFQSGLVEEVKRLVEMGYDKNSVAMQGIGYKEVLLYLRGEISLDEAIYIIKRDSRHYAKRQITWFKRLENVHWLETDIHNIDELMLDVKKHIATYGIF